MPCAGMARPQGGSGTAFTDSTGQEATSKWRELGAGTAACLLFLVLQVPLRPRAGPRGGAAGAPSAACPSGTPLPREFPFCQQISAISALGFNAAFS